MRNKSRSLGAVIFLFRFLHYVIASVGFRCYCGRKCYYLVKLSIVIRLVSINKEVSRMVGRIYREVERETTFKETFKNQEISIVIYDYR